MAANCIPTVPVVAAPVTTIPGLPCGPGWATVVLGRPAQGVIFVPARRR
ncbi:hypothetical protein [Kutzneria chonburiensis]|uniref:Uncharacterized protein n=1 Tax=Kutzneria chonburiensis TaxID=1483604 RepID=A0ABV6MZR9_9PSEU|nr:hypothetical protein [Kutzneria chonburiensis]